VTAPPVRRPRAAGGAPPRSRRCSNARWRGPLVPISRIAPTFKGCFGWIADLRQIPCRTAKFAPIPDNITGRQRKPHSRTAHTIGDETAGLAARRKTQIFEAVANGGGLSYMHSGMYGRGSVRQMRSTAPAQIPGTKISVCRGVGGMFTASGTIIMSSRHSAVSVSIAR